ncbi:hypothetical protein U0070_003688 [Myodes glareolus]|uniref:Uncharacterized protein n=1 Tax=Myodes glareolus TaxID=447135 RepID=A0AAW0IHP8_MYOGA
MVDTFKTVFSSVTRYVSVCQFHFFFNSVKL